jgi:mono/diheme cytochrome c family protein
MMKRMGLAAIAAIALTQSAAAQPAVERGRYLVNTIMTCGNCHTPKGPNGDIMDKAFSGGLEFDEPPFKVTAANITPDRETGIGKWSDADIKTLLLTGVRPNGVPIAAVMPTGFYGILTPADLDAIVAYLRTLKPVRNQVPDPVYKITVKPQIFPGAEKPFAGDPKDKVAHGFYLATIGHCMECHTPMGPQGRNFVRDLGTGGFALKGPWGVSVSRNITQSKTKGIGAWSDDEIRRAITQGISRDGSKLRPPMGFHYYAAMTAPDIDAIVAWLRTVPAKD